MNFSRAKFRFAFACCLAGSGAIVAAEGPSGIARLDSPSSAPGTNREVIAVNDFEAKGIAQTDADLITEQIRSQIVGQHRVSVMERSMMAQILREQGFQQSGGCDTADCQVQVGRLLGVGNLVVGSIGKVGRIYMLNAKLVDVTTGEVMQSITETCEGSIEDLLRNTTGAVAKQITHLLIKKQSGILTVQTVPSGSVVKVGNVQVGIAPYLDSLVDPGSTFVEVSQPDWKTQSKPVSITKGQLTNLEIQMDRSDEWIAAQKRAISQKKFTQRLILGVSGAGAIGLGAYFHHMKSQEDRKTDGYVAAYNSAQTQADFDAARSQVSTHEDYASKDAEYRNICWAVGGILLASISLTYAF